MIFVLLVLAAVAVFFGIGNTLAVNLVGISASIKFTDDIPAKTSLFPQIVTIPMTFFFGWCYSAVAIKRLHDRDKSGWWMIPFTVAIGLYGQFGHWLAGSWAATFIGWPVFICFIWGLVEMYCLKGTRGPNRFGPDPRAPRETPTHWDQLGLAPHLARAPAGASQRPE